jgi:hypothetical protein
LVVVVTAAFVVAVVAAAAVVTTAGFVVVVTTASFVVVVIHPVAHLVNAASSAEHSAALQNMPHMCACATAHNRTYMHGLTIGQMTLRVGMPGRPFQPLAKTTPLSIVHEAMQNLWVRSADVAELASCVAFTTL